MRNDSDIARLYARVAALAGLPPWGATGQDIDPSDPWAAWRRQWAVPDGSADGGVSLPTLAPPKSAGRNGGLSRELPSYVFGGLWVAFALVTTLAARAAGVAVPLWAFVGIAVGGAVLIRLGTFEGTLFRFVLRLGRVSVQVRDASAGRRRVIVNLAVGRSRGTAVPFRYRVAARHADATLVDSTTIQVPPQTGRIGRDVVVPVALHIERPEDHALGWEAALTDFNTEGSWRYFWFRALGNRGQRIVWPESPLSYEASPPWASFSKPCLRRCGPRVAGRTDQDPSRHRRPRPDRLRRGDRDRGVSPGGSVPTRLHPSQPARR